ncbi:MAG: UvrD-helicase domain-containing protein [Kineosporiaceae bacterium]
MTAEVFDLAGPLPSGTAVLEASAGTGKTYTVSGLAARYLAEGVARIDELLVVTFGVLATAEVRDRTRARLVEVHRGLADPATAAVADDAVLRVLSGGSPDQVGARRARLRTALAAFDDGAVETTHGFCNRMLTGLGLAGDADPHPEVVTSVDDLVREVVGDFYLRKYAHVEDEPPLTRADAEAVVRQAAAFGDAVLLPVPAPDDPEDHPAVQRFRLAVAARGELDRRKRARRLRAYEDMLTGLRDALDDDRRPLTAATARDLLRQRYRVVLVDEFQDTDPVQWDVLRSAFHGHATMVLVGDPKQSIYRFRGADVVTYLGARGAAARQWTLGTNYRSDAPVLDAVGAVLGGLALGDPGIRVGPVAAHHTGRRLMAADGSAAPAMRLRVVPREPRAPAKGLFAVAAARDMVVADVAADVVGLLASGATLGPADEPGRPVRPADVAVLVRTNDQGRAVHAALTAAGVPATLSGADSVFAGPTAVEWLRFLRALEQPHRSGLVRAAALTCFVGWTARQLAEATDGADGVGSADAADGALDALTERVRAWSRVASQQGIAALLESVTATTALPARVLARPGGDRVLTDLRHIGQMLHDEATRRSLGLSALVTWLRTRMDEGSREYGDERSLRLESDAAAVQVLTVHRSKGLEWPVVHVPFLWDRWVPDKPDPLRLHVDGRRALDVGGRNGPGWAARLRLHQDEDAGEDLRLLYVALTRAACQVVAWWAPTRNTGASPLHRVLFAEPDGSGGLPATVPVPPSDAEVDRRVAAVAARASGTVSVERAVPAPGPAAVPAVAPVVPGPARTLDRRLDPAWARTSYTRLTSAAHEAPAGPLPPVEPEQPVRDDERDVTAADAVEGPDAGDRGQPASQVESALESARESARESPVVALPSPMADLPAGARLGTEVHAILELVDPAAPGDLAAELRRAARAVAAAPVTSADRGSGVAPDELAAALLPALRTPLGPATGGRALGDVPAADRLAELDFELPLAGGDGPRRETATVAAVAGLLRELLPADDPLAGYPDALDRLAAQGPPRPLRGYLTGSIDALLRVPADAGGHRYLVVDYKTNRLAPETEPLTSWHYRPDVLVAEMVTAHYPLQALLYSVATHRFLRWRVPGYAPDAHLGGALYLFLRGMCGPDTPVVDGVTSGVFAWRPPATLVTALSDLLDGGPV